MTKVKNLNNAEQAELLRYFVGNPPYIQDARFRDLRDIFAATDERTENEDSRYNVDYERQRISDADGETGSIPNDVASVQNGKQVQAKPDSMTNATTETKAK